MTVALAPALIALLSFILRITNLSTPKGFVFDEVYYVDGARDLLAYGVEVTGREPEFIVHPPLGKWLIALGIKIFGDNEFGWRIATAIFGTLLILLIAMIAHQLFRSPLLTACASLLMALDGLALVHSRTALLDLFLTFFTLGAIYFWIIRKEIWVGIFLGLGLATKWSAAYFIAILFAMALFRIFTFHQLSTMPRAIGKKFLSLILLPTTMYIASWFGWFKSSRGWDRDWSSSVIASFWHYHAEILNFHTTLTQSHSYQSNPWTWLLMARPTSFFYASPSTCGATSCSQEVVALGTPLLWWAGAIALVVVCGLWVKSAYLHQRDRALNVIMAGMAAGYLPWFFFQGRTVFSFYAIIIEPYLILALLYCAKRALAIPYRQSATYASIALYLVAVAINFFYFLPLYIGKVITYDQWYARMWFKSWI